MKKNPVVQQVRVKWSKRTNANAIKGLTFNRLNQVLESFATGYISEAARVWDKMETRDPILCSVASKRRQAVARWTYEIQAVDKSPAALEHKKTLEYFYNNLSATNAYEENSQGGVSLMVRQMLDCVGKRYSVHEIVWKPDAQGLTAQLRFVPLWFFENTQGRLRYLSEPNALQGTDMPDGEWLVCVGPGLMEASGVAYLFKHMPLRDWVIYSERHGMPGIQGKTSATKGSTQWNAMVDAVQAYSAEFAAVMSQDESITSIDLSTKGDLPYPKLVEYIDRCYASLWRGSDLGTISSAPGGTGSSVQGDETDLIEHDDATLVSEAVQRQLDRFVIQYAFGYGVRPLAYFKLVPSSDVDRKSEITIDTALQALGLKQAQSDLYARYGRRQPEDGDILLEAPASRAAPGMPSLAFGNERSLQSTATDQVVEAARVELAKAQAKTLLPLRTALAEAAQIEDPAQQQAALKALQERLPEMLKKMNLKPETAKVLENTMSAALLNGAAIAKGK